MRRNNACPPHSALRFVALAALGLAPTAMLAACASNPTPRCATSTDCASGDTCYRGFCIAGEALDTGPAGRDAGACPFGQTACGMDCVNLLSDRDHCGTCAMACHGMMGNCSFGHCVAD